MNFRKLSALIGITALFTVFFCSCSPTVPQATVITKQSVNSPTQTTTTTTTTVAPTDSSGSSTVPGATTAPAAVVPPEIIAESGSSEIGNAIAKLAASLVGTPYAAGASGPDSFDNPGFVTYCYRQSGFTVPRRATAMMTYGREVNPDEIQPGDIMIFCNEIGEEAGFVGIYIGDNRFISCNNPESPTKVQKLNASYWSQRFLAARRFPQQ